MNYRNKHTKIVATISDMRCDSAFIKQMYDHGMDVVRMNTAHQSIEGTVIAVKNIRAVNDKIPIMIDTKGPEVRVCPLEAPIEVKTGDIFKFVSGTPDSKATKELIAVNYPRFVADVPVGTKIMIDDAHMCLTVISKTENFLECRAENNGFIKGKKSINVPGVHMHNESLSKKDIEYIKFAMENGIEFIAHSFVRNKSDCIAIQKILDEGKSRVKIIAKIENQEGVDNIDEILDHVYGVMVARGDLGVEVPAAEVPMIQKMLIRKCVRRQKPVIVATQMLESMIKNPRPTRAEVSDVANAVLDGTSALMLSGESANGDYPLEAVTTLSTIAIELEAKKFDFKQSQMEHKAEDVRMLLSKAAISACADLGAKAIICPTVTGKTPRCVSSFRAKWPIYAQCYDPLVMRRLALSYGVFPSLMSQQKTTDQLVSTGIKQLVDAGDLSIEDQVVILARTPGHDEEATNFMEVTTVKHALDNYKD